MVLQRTGKWPGKFTYTQLKAILRNAKKWPGVLVMLTEPAKEPDRIYV